MPSQQLAAGVPAAFGAYGTLRMQVVGLSGGDTIVVNRTLDGSNFDPNPETLITGGPKVLTTITADGIYTLAAGGAIKWTKTGSASSPVVTVELGG